MNIGHRINARKIVLCYIFRDFFSKGFNSGVANMGSGDRVHHQLLRTEDDSAENDHYLQSINIDPNAFILESNKIVDLGACVLSDIDDDIAMITQNLRMNGEDVDRDYVYSIVSDYSDYIVSIKELVDKHITQFAREDMDILKKSIFILGYTEQQTFDTDLKVIINEMIELAKRFGGADTYKLINSILHKILLEGVEEDQKI